VIGTALIVGAAAVAALATQPLSPLWTKVFQGFAIGAGVLAASIVLILVRRDSYLLAAFRAADRAAGTGMGSGRVGRFTAAVGRQVGDLLRDDWRRLAVLSSSALIGYACMSAEVWLVLRAVGIPISFGGATAVETFMRVVSFASAV